MIERLLVLKLDAVDCEAEAWLNGIPLARAHPGRPRVLLPVHEYTMTGDNQLALMVWPYPATMPPDKAPPQQRVIANGRCSAHVRLLLPRTGKLADEGHARTLGQIDWAPDAGQAHVAPLPLDQTLNLPINFPRWRWLDAPAIDDGPALQALVAEQTAQWASQLSQGQPEAFLAALRLRVEEVAAAYQRDARSELDRLRSHLIELAEARRLDWLPLEPAALVLRRVARGRLFECLRTDGTPWLSTKPDADGRQLAWPMRLTAVEGRLYVLR
jgi:hypothetical protein